MSGTVLEFFEIDIPYCSRTYGVAPCTASIPTTGDAKCFNCLSTCQDTANFDETTKTLRFAKPTEDLPRDIDIVGPWIRSIDHTPATISLAENLGTRALLKVTLEDHPHSDAGDGLDKYQADRGYDPYQRGSFWPRFRARYPSANGYPSRWKIGEPGEDIADMESRSFFVDSFNGPASDGAFSFTAKDAVKFLDGAAAQIPVLSAGSLLADISDSATSMSLTPSGVGADYPGAGLVNIAGKEIARYWTTGLDDYVTLLLHADGADGATTFTDSSGNSLTVTAGGNAQLDTAQFKFGSASVLFDGTGDYLQLDGSSGFAFGAEDFTIDFWSRRNSTGGLQILYDSRPTGTEGLYPTIYFANDNTLRYYTNSADRITSGGTFSTGSWIHIALVRASGVTKLYANGVLQGSGYTDSNSYLNGASRPRIGGDGLAVANGFNGWIDEIRVTNGLARWTAAFTAPTAAAGTATDVFQLPERGALNTAAAAHSAADRAQLVKHFPAMAAADIIAEALGYTELPSAYIPLAEWQLEDSTNIGTLYTFTLGEPTSVGAFVSRVLEQCGGMLWDDALAQQLRFKAIKAVPTSADTISESNVINKTFEPIDQPEQRVSRAWVYFGIGDPTKRRDDLDNYRQSVKVPEDATAEENEALYGSQSIRKIIADGIAIGGGTVAERVGNLVVGRKQRPPRRFRWSMLRGENRPQPGGGYYLDWRSLQDASGARELIPVQIISVKISSTVHQFLAEEMRFTDLDAGSLLDRVFLLNFDDFNLDLRAIHDLTYPSDFTGVSVTFIIAATIGSRLTSSPAINVGAWPITPSIVNQGRIQGHGGRGGGNQPFGVVYQSGEAGGTALYTRTAVDLDNTDGEILGGGGGGSAKYAQIYGGGGGAGTEGGDGGWGSVVSGNPGTADAGGNSGGAFIAGFGGGPGLAGSSPGLGNDSGVTAGAAGNAIDGDSYVTYSGTGDIRGGQVN